MTRLDLTPAATQIVTLIRSVPDDQLKAPTPCTEATLGDLIEHVRGCAFAFGNAARKGGGEVAEQGAALDMTQLPGDWRRSVPRDVEALAEAWNDEAAWTGMTRAGGMD